MWLSGAELELALLLLVLCSPSRASFSSLQENRSWSISALNFKFF